MSKHVVKRKASASADKREHREGNRESNRESMLYDF